MSLFCWDSRGFGNSWTENLLADLVIILFTHALFLCPKLSVFWAKIHLWNHDTLKRCTNFIDLLGYVFVEYREPALFSMVMWNFWNWSNNLRLGKGSTSLDQLLRQAQEQLQEFKRANTTTTTTIVSSKQPGNHHQRHGTRSTSMGLSSQKNNGLA